MPEETKKPAEETKKESIDKIKEDKKDGGNNAA